MMAQSICCAASISLRDPSRTRVSVTPCGSSSGTFSSRPGAFAPAWYQSTSVSLTPISLCIQPRMYTAAVCAHSGEPIRLPCRSSTVSMALFVLT